MRKGPQQQASKRPRERNDLWFQWRGNEWFLEAKHVWCEIQRGKQSLVKTIEDGMRAAEKSAKHVRDKPRIAALFVTPLWRGKTGAERDLDSDLKDWERTLREFCPRDDDRLLTVARSRYKDLDAGKGRNIYWLGVALILKDIDFSRR